MRTVTDLILELEQIRYEHGGDTPVLVDGYEDDFSPLRCVYVPEVADKGEDEAKASWWNGRYENSEFAEEELPRFKAVVISR